MSRQNWTLSLFCPVHLLLMQIPFSLFLVLCRFLFSLLIQIPYFPLHFGQISSIMDIGFFASKR